MKRMHLHVTVDDISKSISFYNHLFGAVPTVVKPDYAKWMLDDPVVNFAISQRGATAGLDHIGIQVESDTELAEIKERLEKAELNMLTQEGTTCCYAKSDKHWVQDPSGIAWETYHTLDSAPTFSGQTVNSNNTTSNDKTAEPSAPCCVPASQMMDAKIQFISRK